MSDCNYKKVMRRVRSLQTIARQEILTETFLPRQAKRLKVNPAQLEKQSLLPITMDDVLKFGSTASIHRGGVAWI